MNLNGHLKTIFLCIGINIFALSCTTTPNSQDFISKDFFLGSNVFFERCDVYPGGMSAVRQSVERALKAGLSCLADLGGMRAKDAQELDSFFEKPSSYQITFRCVHEMEWLGKNSRGSDVLFPKGVWAENYGDLTNQFPAIAINLDAGQNPDLHATLFHEMIHWLGYLHLNGTDVAYLSEICCFRKNKDLKNNACSLLKSGLDWKSTEYQTRFSLIMEQDRRPSLGLQDVWASTLAPKKIDSNAKINPTGLYLSADQMARNGRYPFLGKIYAQAAFLALPALNPEFKSDQPNFTEFEKFISIIVSAPLGGASSEAANQAWQKLKILASASCTALTPAEQVSLREILSTTSLSLFEVTPKLDSDLLLNWTRLCSD